ncbi:MAG: DUF2723 domain-containing protein [Actinomycetia bacterium]|nr:DUF2723 domain-containing protein [Actinomycetes bacterium]
MADKIRGLYGRWKNIIFMALAFTIPFVIYVLTLERKLVGGDTTWYALQIPEMSIMVPTGYPAFSLLLKLFTFLPVGDLAYRLNLFSALFGGLTILFLFLAINKLIKNEIFSLSGSLIFSFLFPYWSIANRLEFDTLNSFFIVLVLYSAVLYNGIKNRKFLYFFFFCLGLSLTNHPIAFFVVPAILLYVIIENSKIFKSLRAVLISILYFILPLLSYFYLLIRSRQGHGPVTDPVKLFYYMTGRKVTGTLHGGTFFDESPGHVLGVMGDYLWIIYDAFGPILIIVAVAGLVYLIRKNWKFGLCLMLFMGFNIIVPPLYLPFANDNYVIDSMIVAAIFISFGFLLIMDGSAWLFKKAVMDRKLLKADRFLKYLMIAAIFITSMAIPIFQVTQFYKVHDRSEPLSIYKFWEQAFENMEEDSVIYVHATSENVGMFLDRYEYHDKNIDFYCSRTPGYSQENALKDFEAGRDVYFVGREALFKFIFNTEKVGRIFLVRRYGEFLQLYKTTGVFKSLKIDYSIDGKVKEFGEKFQIEFTIENKNPEPVQITSIELELPGNIDLLNVDPEGYISQGPGMSRGIYMWVSDNYVVDPDSEVNLIVYLQGTVPGKGVINFRITTHDVYIEASGIEIDIK